MKPKILVVGSINMDLIMYGLNDLPRWGVSTFGNEYRYAAGGKGANQAFAVSKLGGEAYMVGRVGNDDNGKSLLNSLKNSGVHTEYIVIDKKNRSGLSTMNMNNEGKYFSIYVPGANLAMQTEDLEKALSSDNKFDMILMQLEMPRELVYKICEIGRRKKIPIFLDAGPAIQIPLEKLKGTFIISPNEAETKALTGIEPISEKNIELAAKMIYDKSEPEYVLLKLGSRGAYLYSDTVQKIIPCFKVEAVDTTAAGDTFGAAFCVEYNTRRSIDNAITYAHAAAAICVTRKGGQPSIPTREETDLFLSSKIM